jgi:hypothetical protein
VGTAGDYEFAHVELVRGGVPVGKCDQSRAEATSKEPFGVVVWGTDSWASYAYSAGGNLRALNKVAVTPPK